MITSLLPNNLGWPQVSMSPKVTMGLSPTKTVALVVVVSAAQCVGGQPLAPQQG